MVNPYKTKPTRNQAVKIATASVIIITLILAIQLGITNGLVTTRVDNTFSNSSFNATDEDSFHTVGEKTVCDVLPQYDNYFKYVFRPMVLLFTRLLYPAIVIICNLTIIRYLRKHATQVAPMISINATTPPQNDKRITKLLIIVSLCFTVLNLPTSIYIVLVPYFYNNVSEAVAPDNPAFQVVMDCQLINHSINYFLYILASKTFRKEAVVAFRSLFSIFARNNQN